MMQKLFSELPDRICDESVIAIFNQYQYISADEDYWLKRLKILIISLIVRY